MRVGLALLALVAAWSQSAGAQIGSASGMREIDAQARQLLLSTPWCSFTYNKVSGATHTSRVVFRPDGALRMSSGAQTYSSGYGGSTAGESRGAQTMRWHLEQQRLYVDDGGGFRDVGLTASRNSNGAVILRADGKEYASCR